MIFIDWPAVYQSLASSIFMALFLLLSGLFVSFMQKIRYFWIMLYTVVVKSILTIWHCAIIRERQKSLGNWTGLYILPRLELNLRLGADSWKLLLFVVFCSHSDIDLPPNTSHWQLLYVHFFVSSSSFSSFSISPCPSSVTPTLCIFLHYMNLLCGLPPFPPAWQLQYIHYPSPEHVQPFFYEFVSKSISLSCPSDVLISNLVHFGHD